MVGTEFFNVTIAMDYHNHNEDSVSAEPRQGIVVVNNGSTSASYVEVDETPNEDYGQDVLKLDADKEAHDHILNCSVPEIDEDKVLLLIDVEYHLFFHIL